MEQDLFGKDIKAAEDREPSKSLLPQISIPPRLSSARLPIADMADAFGVTHRTLHFYEEKGLIAPERLGTMRVYGPESIRRMAVINACREVGIPLAGIQDLMQSLQAATSQEEADRLFRETLDLRKRELTSDVSTLHRQIQQIRTLIIDIGNTEPRSIERNADAPEVSDLERRCLTLMTEGYKGAELARELDVDMEQLVDMEGRLMAKFGASNRFQAAAKAVILGVLPH